LASGDPTPGGGGASALIGALGAALCSMVANLTSGKKKYAEVQADIDDILARTEVLRSTLLNLIDRDAEVFAPLAEAYGIPKDAPGRADTLEAALNAACSVPMEILRTAAALTGVIEQLAVKGSKLAVSDVGVAASACRCAMEGAVMNVYINTRLMQNREAATALNREAEVLLSDGVNRCTAVYRKITDELRSMS